MKDVQPLLAARELLKQFHEGKRRDGDALDHYQGRCITDLEEAVDKIAGECGE